MVKGILDPPESFPDIPEAAPGPVKICVHEHNNDQVIPQDVKLDSDFLRRNILIFSDFDGTIMLGVSSYQTHEYIY